MYIKPFKLKQHTPIIHFQSGEKGATLRASEVKPKLDKFLIKKLGKDNIKKEWKRRDENGEIALDYGMSFVAKGGNEVNINNKKTPMYFGNMGISKDERKELVLHNDGVEGKLKYKHKDLFTEIKKALPEFFFLHNFGTRQSKGYGSFTVESIEGVEVIFEYSSKYSFNLNVNDWQKAMTQLDLFYQSLRSGINIGKPQYYDAEEDGKSRIEADSLEEMNTYFYMKPVIFMYAKNKYKSQWDKKTIKQTFFNTNYAYYRNKKRKFIQTLGLKEQKKSFENIPDVLNFSSSRPYYDFRDLFGLSTAESWRSYGATISKTIKNVDRYKSPIMFKILKEKSKHKVYIIIETINNKNLNNKDVKIKSKIGGRENNKELYLKIPKDFNFNSFFDFICDDFLIERSVKEHHREYKDPSLGNLYDILSKIYDQLKTKTK